MNAALRVLRVLPLAGALLPGILLAGCGGPPSVGSCPELDPPPAGLGKLILDKEDDSYRHSLTCDWHAGETLKVKARFFQPRVARQSYQTEEDIRKRFNRSFLPPLENPAIGEQAVLDLGGGDRAASATVVARKGIRVVEVRYSVPATIPMGRGATDPKHYAAAKAAAVEVAGELLK